MKMEFKTESSIQSLPVGSYSWEGFLRALPEAQWGKYAFWLGYLILQLMWYSLMLKGEKSNNNNKKEQAFNCCATRFIFKGNLSSQLDHSGHFISSSSREDTRNYPTVWIATKHTLCHFLSLRSQFPTETIKRKLLWSVSEDIFFKKVEEVGEREGESSHQVLTSQVSLIKGWEGEKPDNALCSFRPVPLYTSCMGMGFSELDKISDPIKYWENN